MGRPLGEDPIRDLEARLTRRGGDPRFGAHWSRRETTRRARIREHLDAWWLHHGFDKHPATVGKRIALALIARPQLESKIAGIAVLARLGDQLRAADLASFAALLAAGQLDQPNLIDWFATKIVAPLLDQPANRAVLARWLVEWAGQGSPAHRRCACHALVPHAHDRGLAPLILLVCGTAVWSLEPTDQAIVGLLLKQLAHVEPRRVEAFVRRVAHLMNKACIRTATERFGVALRTELLVHWKRATRIRRR